MSEQRSPEKLSTDAIMKARARAAMRSIQKQADFFGELVKGTHVRIIRDFHDQPHGRSKPNLKGKEFIVSGVWMDGNRTSIRCVGLWCAPDLDDVEFI